MSSGLRIALIGFGAMGRALAAFLRRESPSVQIVGIAVRSERAPDVVASLPEAVRWVHTPEELAALDADLVVECAGHAALRSFGPSVLERGRDLLVASVGALADRQIEASLKDSAARSGARILIASGALGGLDALAAARIGGLEAVTYAGRKPPQAWRGTRAEELVKLDGVAHAQRPFFEGTARAAALSFPQNANVTAAVAIAGLGFDATRVELYADPASTGNEHRVHAHGAFGSFDIAVRATALAENPKTSMLAPCSLARSILNRRATVALA